MYPIETDLALLIIRVVAGLIIAAHGAQKLFGVFGGPGLQKWHGAVAAMGFVQPRVMGTLAAFTEFFGGLAFAIGLYTPVVAAMLCVDMLVAVFKVHRPKGFFVQGGGYEYPLLLTILFAVIGVMSDPIFFAVVLVIGAGVTLVAATVRKPAEVTRTAPR